MMPEIKFNNIPNAERISIFQQISNEIGMPTFAVEKDWWVVQTLAAIFELEIAAYLVFKGGTSLSKAWKLIERFSEDVDLAVDRSFFGFDGDLSKKQRTQLRKASSKYISTNLIKELEAKFIEKGLLNIEFKLVDTTESDQDPTIIEIYYPNIIDSPGYIKPKVQIEIGCRSLREPFSIQSIASLIDEQYSNTVFTENEIKVPTVNPERTFLEKIFLLHEEFQKPEDKIRVDRLSRHLYDIYQLAKTEFATKALSDKSLYETIVNHRYSFTRVSGVDYNLHQPQFINPIPNETVLNAWKADYKLMQEQMIYVSSPPFEEIINGLISLKNKINTLDWKLESVFKIHVSE